MRKQTIAMILGLTTAALFAVGCDRSPDMPTTTPRQGASTDPSTPKSPMGAPGGAPSAPSSQPAQGDSGSAGSTGGGSGSGDQK